MDRLHQNWDPVPEPLRQPFPAEDPTVVLLVDPEPSLLYFPSTAVLVLSSQRPWLRTARDRPAVHQMDPKRHLVSSLMVVHHQRHHYCHQQRLLQHMVRRQSLLQQMLKVLAALGL